jgi:hypothetical protein
MGSLIDRHPRVRRHRRQRHDWGFILGGGDDGAQVLIRALGPSLAQFGVTDVLADPTLELHNANGDPAASNDSWNPFNKLISKPLVFRPRTMPNLLS